MTITLRNLIVIFMVLHVMEVRDALATRLGPRHARSLLAHGTILTDYIGSSGDTSVHFTDVPLSAGVSYIFPLSFAIDADAAGNVANGVFSPYWTTSSLTPQAAQAFVQANSNVKLAVCLGGSTQFISATNTRSVDWYDPADTNAWITNAVNSISALASQYAITGIDIDYENFPSGSATFTACIGGLITQLKNAGTVTTASIAPFGNTRAIYTDLFQSVGSSIDYVNYQFYADGLTSQSDYVSKFNDVATTFGASKLLASAAVGRGLQGTDFIGSVQQLPQVAGIMIFDVDHDKAQGFSLTQSAATFLTS